MLGLFCIAFGNNLAFVDSCCASFGCQLLLLTLMLAFVSSFRYYNFNGTKWQNVNSDSARKYLKNAYRVLLTRARQGMIIYVPKGDACDMTRPPSYYDETFDYLVSLGLNEI